MSRTEQMRDFMMQIYLAHKEFAVAWEASKSANFKPNHSYDVARSSEAELKEMLRANGQAYIDAKPQEDRLYALLRSFYENYLNPLMLDFESGKSQAIDSVLDFLEIDIPAFRLGYDKEHFYTKLKHLPLSEDQVKRLRQIAYTLCANPQYRREFRKATRLMICLADESFVREIIFLSKSTNEFVQKKAKRMLSIILNGRKDLGHLDFMVSP